MAYLKVRPDKLDDTAAQLAGDHLVGASPRGWEDISSVLQFGPVGQRARVSSCKVASARRTPPNSSACCAKSKPQPTWCALLAAAPGKDTLALLPRTLDGLYGMLYGLLAAANDSARLARALAIVEQLPEVRASVPLPLREAKMLAMELLLQKALQGGLEATVLDSAAYRRYAAQREADGPLA